MSPSSSLLRRAAAALLVAFAASACASQAQSRGSALAPAALVEVEVYDRTARGSLPVHPKDRHNYVVGTPGHEYALRIRNRTAARVLVVTSVDGVNVISGETATPSQSGYVLDPWGSVEISGWRKNLDRTAAFFFTDHANSYAARTGRPHDVGVIGFAVFQERARPVARDDVHLRGNRAIPGESRAPAAERAEAGPGVPASSSAPPSHEDAAGAQHGERAPTLARKLGTGHGRSESSRVRLVDFERASATPAEAIAIHYDRRERLVALGVLPAPAHYSSRHPEPFPGVPRFVPDPPR